MIEVPVSIGELIDKYTILKLKEKYCKDNNKMKNILHEKIILKERIEKIKILDFDTLHNRLYNVNHKLWTIEEDIRKLEEKQDFGSDFIICAHCVIVFNDMRSKIKKEINVKCNSDIHEEKLYDKYNSEIKNKSLLSTLNLYLQKLDKL